MSDQTVPDMDTGTCRPTGTSPPSRLAQGSRKPQQIKGPFICTIENCTVVNWPISFYVHCQIDMSGQTVPDMDTGTCRPTGTSPPSRPAQGSRKPQQIKGPFNCTIENCTVVNWPISFNVHCHIDMSDQTVPDMDTGTCRLTGTSPPSRPAQESRKLQQIKGPFLLTVPLKTVPLLISLSVSMYIAI